jgi:hypothetical protein
MKRYFISFIIVGLVAAACHHDDDQEFILVPDYFPLQEGNYWLYQSVLTPSNDVWRTEFSVLGVVKFGGTDYFKTLLRELDGQVSDTIFYRVDQQGHVFSRGRNSPEVEVYDLAASKGQSWHSQGDGVATFIDFVSVTLNDNVTVKNCREYSLAFPNVSEQLTAILAPGIGIIRTTGNSIGDVSSIVEARINGVTIKFE